MDWNQPFRIKNVSHGRLVVDTLSVPHGEHSKVIDPLLYSEEFIGILQKFHLRKLIESTNAIEEEAEEKMFDVRELETVKNEHGETREHTVFDPQAAPKKSLIEVTEHTSGKAIEVQEIHTSGKAIEVDFNELDRKEAEEFLAQHWKKVEAGVEKMQSLKKIAFYLRVAESMGAAPKKVEILENRIKTIRG